MKAITLWQPWASLVALGLKTIETRSWQTAHRGPIAIHAAARCPKPQDLKRLVGDDERVFDAWFEAGLVSENGRRDLIPRGVVIATANLVDVAPIGRWDSFRTGIFEGDGGDFPGRHVVVVHLDGEVVLDHPPGCGHPHGTVCSIAPQLPFGDFTPGRYAWLLEDVERVDPPVAARGGQRIWTWERSSPVVGCR